MAGVDRAIGSEQIVIAKWEALLRRRKGLVQIEIERLALLGTRTGLAEVVRRALEEGALVDMAWTGTGTEKGALMDMAGTGTEKGALVTWKNALMTWKNALVAEGEQC